MDGSFVGHWCFYLNDILGFSVASYYQFVLYHHMLVCSKFSTVSWISCVSFPRDCYPQLSVYIAVQQSVHAFPLIAIHKNIKDWFVSFLEQLSPNNKLQIVGNNKLQIDV